MPQFEALCRGIVAREKAKMIRMVSAMRLATLGSDQDLRAFYGKMDSGADDAAIDEFLRQHGGDGG